MKESASTSLMLLLLRASVCAFSFLLLFGLASQAGTNPIEEETALDRYIAKPDPSYSWKLIKTLKGKGCRGFVLELTSQAWRNPFEVDRPIWKHWLTVVKPDKATSNKAMLIVGDGSNFKKAPSQIKSLLTDFALGTNTVVAELGMVPNQPLYFYDLRKKARSGDDLLAYSQMRHMKSGDDTWLVQLPMVKSGVRGMDAIQEFLATDEGGNLKVDQFVVSGGSKRGWTTWLMAAVDKRVIAIMPTVIDVLNLEAIMRHHYEAYGFFSPSLHAYIDHKLIPDKLGTPEYDHLLEIEDPFNYRNRDSLRIPKYLLNASGDEYFLPDNPQFYFEELQGEKYLRYIPNATHDLQGSDASKTLLVFYKAILSGKARPHFSWKKQKDGSLLVTAKEKPRLVNLWQATNPRARDFRVEAIGNAFKSTRLKEEKPGVYVGRVAKPPSGYTAFFVEMVYESGETYPFKFTTEVHVVPDVLPFKFPEKPGQADITQ